MTDIDHAFMHMKQTSKQYLTNSLAPMSAPYSGLACSCVHVCMLVHQVCVRLESKVQDVICGVGE